MTIPFKPYQNETDSIEFGNFTVKNRVDRVSIYGSIDLTKDKEGLAQTRELKKIIDLTLAELEKSDLPEKIDFEVPETIENPFE